MRGSVGGRGCIGDVRRSKGVKGECIYFSKKGEVESKER